MSHDEKVEHGHGSFEQEPDRLPAKTILYVVGVTSAVMLAMSLLAWRMLAQDESDLRPAGFAADENMGRPHRVQGVHQGIFDLESTATQLGEPKREALRTYGWIDRPTGTVRIPIERAMELFPGIVAARAPTPPTPPVDPVPVPPPAANPGDAH